MRRVAAALEMALISSDCDGLTLGKTTPSAPASSPTHIGVANSSRKSALEIGLATLRHLRRECGAWPPTRLVPLLHTVRPNRVAESDTRRVWLKFRGLALEGKPAAWKRWVLKQKAPGANK